MNIRSVLPYKESVGEQKTWYAVFMWDLEIKDLTNKLYVTMEVRKPPRDNKAAYPT